MRCNIIKFFFTHLFFSANNLYLVYDISSNFHKGEFMDRTHNSTIFFKEWESLCNAGSFLLAGALLSGTRAISWLKYPVSKEEVLITSALNGCGILLADKISKNSRKEDSYFKTALTLIFFALSTFAAPYVAATFLRKTVTKISLQAAFQIGSLNLCIKAATYAYCKFYQPTPNQSNQVSIPTDTKEINDLSPESLNKFRTLLNDQDKWNVLNLVSQIAWNRIWQTNEISPLLFTKLNPQEKPSKADLLLIHKIHENDLSEQYSEFQKKCPPPSEQEIQKVFSPELDSREIEIIDLASTFQNPEIKATEFLHRCSTLISWAINKSDTNKCFNGKDEFWDAVTNIDNVNIIKIISYMIEERLPNALSFSLSKTESHVPVKTSVEVIETKIATVEKWKVNISFTVMLNMKENNLKMVAAQVIIPDQVSLKKFKGIITFFPDYNS